MKLSTLLVFCVVVAPAVAQRFGPEESLSGDLERPRSFELVDMDGDGDLDVLAAVGRPSSSLAPPPNVIWMENLGDGDFSTRRYIGAASLAVRSVTALDVDEDGDLDVVGGGESVPALFWHERGPHDTFSTSQSLSQIDLPVTRTIAADLDGDGADDLLVVVNGVRIAWHANIPNGDLGPRQFLYLGGGSDGILDLVADDLDGDGDVDVAALDLSLIHI